MRLYDTYVFDLDGTVFLGDALLPTAGETISALARPVVRSCFSPTTRRTPGQSTPPS